MEIDLRSTLVAGWYGHWFGPLLTNSLLERGARISRSWVDRDVGYVMDGRVMKECVCLMAQ